ncbi:MAG: fumarylacetoacetase [Rhodospirillales bacterium]|jgi:fumarylacetoacetase|nr:fumarylacetoacetase [Rhodospirillales bacterium]
MIDETHDPARASWIASANGHADFPIQNLPFGVFSPPDGGTPRGGVAIGGSILDLWAAASAGLFAGAARDAAEAASGPALNPLLALGDGPRIALRRRLSALLDRDGPERGRIGKLADRLLHPIDRCALHLPAAIGDYTDFFAGIQHATNTGRLFRPDNPLLPNYKYVPVAYHGRASSVRVSGVPVRRPSGQRKPPDQPAPDFGPCRTLDYELELGIWVGPGNDQGVPIPIARAGAHVAGFCLLNDWSARDIQAWEYQPLGPFLAKSFHTTISPWVVTAEAMAPFRVPARPRGADEPAPLPYLSDAADQAGGGLAIRFAVALLTPRMREAGRAPHKLSAVGADALYWTVAQMVSHHTSNGCNLRPGDLFGSGTLSGADPGSFGSLMELTQGGRAPLMLPDGETRRFLEDGDEVILTAQATAPGRVPIGFGACRGVVLGAG